MLGYIALPSAQQSCADRFPAAIYAPRAGFDTRLISLLTGDSLHILSYFTNPVNPQFASSCYIRSQLCCNGVLLVLHPDSIMNKTMGEEGKHREDFQNRRDIHSFCTDLHPVRRSTPSPCRGRTRQQSTLFPAAALPAGYIALVPVPRHGGRGHRCPFRHHTKRSV